MIGKSDGGGARSDPKGADMLPTNLLTTRRNRILRGYAAFTNGDWDALGALLCDDVDWHPMHSNDVITGRDNVIAYLQELRNSTDVELLGVAIQGDIAITVDFSHTTSDEGDHGCADKILFDDSDCIKAVWHCATDTHDHGQAGSSAGHTHA
jgi:predicted SnoaL-like aldol condensation-catalyzing enzyme